jgi:sensor domain CHASE-containing protein
MFIGLHLAAVFILQPSYTRIENQEMIKSLSQLNSALKYQLDTLGASAKDYSSWDDTYRYVQDKNEYYVDSNLVDPTFANLKLNLIAIVDQNKNLIY